jgi:hypothetical protein
MLLRLERRSGTGSLAPVFRYVYVAPLLAGDRIPVLTPTQPIGA